MCVDGRIHRVGLSRILISLELCVDREDSQCSGVTLLDANSGRVSCLSNANRGVGQALSK